MTRNLFYLIIAILISFNVYAQDLPLHLLKLPPGFSIEVYARVNKARAMTLGANGTVFVGTKENSVYALVKPPGQSVRVVTIATGLNQPNGVAFQNGALYVAEVHRIIRYDNIESRIDNPPAPVIIRDGMSRDTWHGLRVIGFGPDGKLYLSLGAPCNVCEPVSPMGTIVRMNPDGSNFEIYARGVRDSLGFDWDPMTQKMWFTDNGRDNLGDDLPPDKLNHAPTFNQHFGFPYYHGKGLPDPVFGSRFPESNFVAPTLELPAHVAALGMKFYKGGMFPGLTSLTMQNAQQIFIAEHGSWNRSSKIGYQVIRVWVCDGKVVWDEPFITGWLQGQQAWGRPVDVLPLNDGSLLVSDDLGNAIYRISYS